MKKLILIAAIIITGLTAAWYFDLWHEPVERIDELIGQNYNYAQKTYFRTVPDEQYTLNINDGLNEFDGGILSESEILTDSIVHVYTWEYVTHKKTIWVGETKDLNSQVIDAIRYKNKIQF